MVASSLLTVVAAIAVLCAMGSSLGCQESKTPAQTVPSDLGALVTEQGEPLFLAMSYELVPFEGGGADKRAQVTFRGVTRYQSNTDARQLAVYSETRQVAVAVTAFLDDDVPSGRTSRMSSFYPLADLHIYSLDANGGVGAHDHVVKIHVLLERD